MYYYAVLVSSPLYKGSAPLTYQGEELLQPGQVVRVPLKNTHSLGVVTAKVRRPAMATKPIDKVVTTRPLSSQFRNLLAWLNEYYPASPSANVSLFMPGYIDGPLTEEPAAAANRAARPKAALPDLNAEQRVAVAVIAKSKQPVLLHGITGSGKTRVYVELAGQALAAGRSVLILTPEIGLTPQLTSYFKQALGCPVLVMHSNLTPKEKRTIWHQVLGAEQPLVVIGPRSALFLPAANWGLIVQDEFHDSAYKQESAPHYLASRVAAKLAKLHGAQLVLGSATPPVTDYYSFKRRSLPVVELNQLATPGRHPAVNIKIVDSTDRGQFSRSAWLSAELINAVETALSRGEQALLFLNRRGSARLILCQNCGWEARCPRCDIATTYHADQHQVTCHTCGYTASAPSVCPSCQSPEIVYKGLGTKALAAEAQRLFPEARVQRFDADNKKAERFEQHYAAIRQGQVDILIGTQILTKGMDLPSLSVVGVVAADSSLSFPDFSAPERTFQLLSQVAGRVGRGHRKGTVVVQSFQPKRPVLKLAAGKDYAGFYEHELRERRQYAFPPFVYLLQLTCARASRGGAQKAAQALAGQLAGLKLPVEILGPTPRLAEKTGGRFHWQIVIKTKDRTILINIIKQLPSGWSYDLDPANLL